MVGKWNAMCVILNLDKRCTACLTKNTKGEIYGSKETIIISIF